MTPYSEANDIIGWVLAHGCYVKRWSNGMLLETLQVKEKW